MTLDEARQELGVSSRSGPAEVRRAFRKLALRHHPDHNAGRADATARFRRVLLAYEILSGQRAPTLADRGAVPSPSAASTARRRTPDKRAPWEMPFVEALPVEYDDGEPLHYPTPDEIRKLDRDDPANPRKMMSSLFVAFLVFVGLLWLLALLAGDRSPTPLTPLQQKIREGMGKRW
jgi:curved DNA-binding protein CbpA